MNTKISGLNIQKEKKAEKGDIVRFKGVLALVENVYTYSDTNNNIWNEYRISLNVDECEIEKT